MGRTIATHWSATTHGTWLHGDTRGSWRNGQLIGPDPFLETAARSALNDGVVSLDASERRLVAKEFGSIIREQRHRIFAATIQPTHIHIVFGPLDQEINTVIARFKYRSAAAVLAHRRSQLVSAETTELYSRAVPAQPADKKTFPARRPTIPKSLWTASQFPVFIFNESHLANAIEYVRDHNRRIGLAPDPFDWIEPLYPAPARSGERMRKTTICEEPRW